MREEDQNTPSSSLIPISIKSTQTPVEHIVSSSDIGMFQRAKEKAAEVMVYLLKLQNTKILENAVLIYFCSLSVPLF